MNLLKEIEKRFHKEGDHRKILNRLKRLKKKYPESTLLQEAIAGLRKKIYFLPGGSYLPRLQVKLLLDRFSHDGIFEISNIKVYLNDRIIQTGSIANFVDLFFSDPFFTMKSDIKVEEENMEEYIAIFSAFDDEGPYQFDSVFLEERDVVIDAGSNMGIFSLLAAENYRCEVHAFEPAAEPLSYLKKNVELNNLNDLIKVYSMGLSNDNNTINIQIDSSHLGRSTIMPDMVLDTVTTEIRNELIQCISLDSWVKENNIQKIDFIKADIEGAERLMLQGATEVLRKFQPKLSNCTYHLPDDPEVLNRIIKKANPKYIIQQGHKKLYAYVKNK
jgi:FkbM family methyltransferase